MPFAPKFRAMMGFPLAGDHLGDLLVESVDVQDSFEHGGQHGYAVGLVLSGPGGQAAVRRALKPFLCAHPTCFSGYGNPYQLWLGKPEIEPLGDRRYAVTARGYGVRVHIAQELERFLQHLDQEGLLVRDAAPDESGDLVTTYLDAYMAGLQRQVDRYRARVRKAEGENPTLSGPWPLE